MRGGLTAEAARAQASRRFGNVLRLREESRDVKRQLWLPTVVQDLRYACRLLRRSPGFAVAAGHCPSRSASAPTPPSSQCSIKCFCVRCQLNSRAPSSRSCASTDCSTARLLEMAPRFRLSDVPRLSRAQRRLLGHVRAIRSRRAPGRRRPHGTNLWRACLRYVLQRARGPCRPRRRVITADETKFLERIPSPC